MKQTRQTPYSILRNQKPENDAISGFSQCHQSQFLSLEQLVSAEYYAHCGQTLFEITIYSQVHDIYFFILLIVDRMENWKIHILISCFDFKIQTQFQKCFDDIVLQTGCSVLGHGRKREVDE